MHVHNTNVSDTHLLLMMSMILFCGTWKKMKEPSNTGLHWLSMYDHKTLKTFLKCVPVKKQSLTDMRARPKASRTTIKTMRRFVLQLHPLYFNQPPNSFIQLIEIHFILKSSLPTILQNWALSSTNQPWDTSLHIVFSQRSLRSAELV